MNYWSSFSGTEDIPENYSEIKYELSVDGNATIYTVIQGGFKSEETLEHSNSNWGYLMEAMKKMLEA